MLRLTQEHFDQIVAHGLEGKPLEICGFIAGRLGSEGDKEVTLVVPIESDDKSELTYSMNPLQQMKAERQIQEQGLEILGIYHTHPATQAYPSKTDVARAHWGDTEDLMYPHYSYLIVSLRDPANPEPHSFRIKGREIPGDIEEEKVVIN